MARFWYILSRTGWKPVSGNSDRAVGGGKKAGGKYKTAADSSGNIEGRSYNNESRATEGNGGHGGSGGGGNSVDGGGYFGGGCGRAVTAQPQFNRRGRS